jgi:hypothetical protein
MALGASCALRRTDRRGISPKRSSRSHPSGVTAPSAENQVTYCALLRAPVRSYDLTARALPQRMPLLAALSGSVQQPGVSRSRRWLGGSALADRLDAMSIGIQHKRAVVIGVIVQPESRRTIVAAPTRKRRRVKGIDRRAESAKADVCTGNRRPHVGFARDGEFDARRRHGREPAAWLVLRRTDDVLQTKSNG